MICRDELVQNAVRALREEDTGAMEEENWVVILFDYQIPLDIFSLSEWSYLIINECFRTGFSDQKTKREEW